MDVVEVGVVLEAPVVDGLALALPPLEVAGALVVVVVSVAVVGVVVVVPDEVTVPVGEDPAAELGPEAAVDGYGPLVTAVPAVRACEAGRAAVRVVNVAPRAAVVF